MTDSNECVSNDNQNKSDVITTPFPYRNLCVFFGFLVGFISIFLTNNDNPFVTHLWIWGSVFISGIIGGLMEKVRKSWYFLWSIPFIIIFSYMKSNNFVDSAVLPILAGSILLRFKWFGVGILIVCRFCGWINNTFFIIALSMMSLFLLTSCKYYEK